LHQKYRLGRAKVMEKHYEIPQPYRRIKILLALLSRRSDPTAESLPYMAPDQGKW
jgi:hypothetical protein